jgi:16S rRNA (adenine1518-N6/adenine1519-N6)-dimethyltransferase
LERVTAAAFGQRRKMLRTSLKALSVDTDVLLSSAGIDRTWRAEQLEPRYFARLAQALDRVE